MAWACHLVAGDRTFRSDVRDRLTAAVGASLIVAERKWFAVLHTLVFVSVIINA